VSNRRKTRTPQTRHAPVRTQAERHLSAVEVAESKPEPLGKGVYAIYELADGSGLLSYRPDGLDEDQHQVIPAHAWRILRKVMEGGDMPDIGNPVAMARTLMGH
jgi:hypothetical protein